MLKSTKAGSGAGMPLGISREELPPRSAGKQKKQHAESVAVIANRIAEQRRAAWQDLQDGKPEAWESLRSAFIQRFFSNE